MKFMRQKCSTNPRKGQTKGKSNGHGTFWSIYWHLSCLQAHENRFFLFLKFVLNVFSCDQTGFNDGCRPTSVFMCSLYTFALFFFVLKFTVNGFALFSTDWFPFIPWFELSLSGKWALQFFAGFSEMGPFKS